jgi:hypothetical protein
MLVPSRAFVLLILEMAFIIISEAYSEVRRFPDGLSDCTLDLGVEGIDTAGVFEGSFFLFNTPDI